MLLPETLSPATPGAQSIEYRVCSLRLPAVGPHSSSATINKVNRHTDTRLSVVPPFIAARRVKCSHHFYYTLCSTYVLLLLLHIRIVFFPLPNNSITLYGYVLRMYHKLKITIFSCSYYY